jgi:D-sedoheptulose 7-phosphate isomerase
MGHAEKYFDQAARICASIDVARIDRLAAALADLRARGGRLFLIGVGGSAANCSHAVNDFRKLCAIEAYSPLDNVAELTARTNDEGWETVFVEWLRTSRLNGDDAVFVFSVGGGDATRGVSVNIIRALDEARERGARIFGVIGREAGYANAVGDEIVVVPTVDAALVTPHTEAFQAVVWHCLVSHPALQTRATTW